MSDPGTVSPPAPPITNEALRNAVEAVKDLSRPFMTVCATLAVCAGIIRINSVEALWVGAAMAGVYGVAKGVENVVNARAGART